MASIPRSLIFAYQPEPLQKIPISYAFQNHGETWEDLFNFYLPDQIPPIDINSDLNCAMTEEKTKKIARKRLGIKSMKFNSNKENPPISKVQKRKKLMLDIEREDGFSKELQAKNGLVE